MAGTIIFGASRGLGAAFNLALPARGDCVWLVARSRPDLDYDDGVERRWIEADLSQADVGQKIAAALVGAPLDLAIYNAGIWESTAFSPGYRFEQVPDEETRDILAVNLASAITCLKAVLPSLRKSKAAKIILIGSTSGLDNIGQPEVAYTASKFGLRGVAHALREVVRKDGIAVTCLNPGNIGTITVKDGKIASRPHERRDMIPPQDLIEIVRCVTRLSNASCVKEIDVMAMTDGA
ncbi:MAG TPA: SDR family oxidoreductase [Dongiaceae bacterium]|jgi:short-subunit dehydrogenase